MMTPKIKPLQAPANDLRCDLCGATSGHAPDCVFPVRRGWGWTGWETETPERAAAFAAAKTEPSEEEQE